MSQTWVVIMAGGAGTRFWPMSRRRRPKQFLSLVSEQSLLLQTARRVAPHSVPFDRVLVVTGEDLAAAVQEAVEDLGCRVVVEPMARNTAPCIALAAALVAHEDPEGVLAVLPSDHHISDEEGFRSVFDRAVGLAAEGMIVTLGMRPSRPETGYGYTLRGAALSDGAYEVERFVEKPDVDTARRYLADGRYDWNSGMFFMRADITLDAVARHLPGLSRGMDAFRRALGTPDETAVLRRAFEGAEATSVDYGIMEKESGRIAVIPADFGWSDVGSWRTMLDFRGPGAANFLRGDVTATGTEGSVVVSDGPHVAVIGMSGVAVVACGDAVLVVPLDRAQEVGDIPKALGKSGRGDLT